jgi:hypothetical protein
MAKGLNYERRMRLASRFSKPATKPIPEPVPKAMSYNRFGVPKEDKEVDTPTKIFGEAAKFLLPSPAMIKQAVQDPSGTIRGGAELVTLGNPVANTMRAINLLQGDGFSLYGADMSDVEQFAELASLIPGGKTVSAPLKAAARVAPRVGRVAEDIALSPVSMLLGTSGAGGGNIARATRQASGAREKAAVADDYEDQTLRLWEAGQLEKSTDELIEAYLTKAKTAGGRVTVSDVSPAVLQGLSYGLSPQEVPRYLDDILRGTGDPSKTKPGQTIEVIFDRPVSKDVRQTKNVSKGGQARTAEAAGIKKEYIVPDEGIDEELAIKEFATFREATDAPAEIRILNADGTLSTTLNPHVDHFMSASAIGRYADRLSAAGNPSLATKISKAVNQQQNMLVYFSKANTIKSRTSPFVWREQLKAKAPDYFDLVHGKGSYADRKYTEAEKYWRDVFGEKEYKEFVEWYDNASLSRSPELYPEEAVKAPVSLLGDFARAMQGGAIQNR